MLARAPTDFCALGRGAALATRVIGRGIGNFFRRKMAPPEDWELQVQESMLLYSIKKTDKAGTQNCRPF